MTELCLNWPCVLCHSAKFMVRHKNRFIEKIERRKEGGRQGGKCKGRKEGRKKYAKKVSVFVLPNS